jgi:branched-chain amino acid transport system ATP-binding protein
MADDQLSPLLECRSVTKRFGALVAVGNLSLELKANEILGIGGPNGAGKTTLFDLISGVVTPDEGGIFLNGQDIKGRSAHEICHLGMARTFQANAAFNSLSVFENVYVAAQFGNAQGLRSALRADPKFVERTEQELEFVGLTQRARTLAAELPAFDRKRLMIASALASNAKCLLMDEPVGGLIPKEIDYIIDLVRRIRGRGIAIILIEHVMRFLVSLSDRILIMQQGQKLFLGPPAAMVADKDVTRVYLGQRASDRMQAFLAKGAP